MGAPWTVTMFEDVEHKSWDLENSPSWNLGIWGTATSKSSLLSLFPGTLLADDVAGSPKNQYMHLILVFLKKTEASLTIFLWKSSNIPSLVLFLRKLWTSYTKDE